MTATDMNRQARIPPRVRSAPAARTARLLVISGVAAIAIAGITGLVLWNPKASDASSAIAVPDRTATVTMDVIPAGPRCPACGMIVSVRNIETHEMAAGHSNQGLAQSSRGREITVRMADGSSRVIYDARPAGWRIGERMMVIDVTDRPLR
jgi:hypothetical protein